MTFCLKTLGTYRGNAFWVGNACFRFSSKIMRDKVVEFLPMSQGYLEGSLMYESMKNSINTFRLSEYKPLGIGSKDIKVKGQSHWKSVK